MCKTYLEAKDWIKHWFFCQVIVFLFFKQLFFDKNCEDMFYYLISENINFCLFLWKNTFIMRIGIMRFGLELFYFSILSVLFNSHLI